MKVAFVNDKVQAKDILDNSHNMDVHNFAVNIILVNLLDSDWLKTVPIKH